MKNLDDEIRQTTTRVDKIRQQIMEKLLSLPDNPKISRVGNRAFTIPFKDLEHGIMEPAYYDFKSRYKHLAEYIEDTPIDHIIPTLARIVEQGYFIHRREKIRLHSDVISHLEALLEAE